MEAVFSSDHFYLAIDGETTFSGAKKHRLCSWAWSILNSEGKVILDTKSVLINSHPVLVDPRAFPIHRLSNEQLAKADKFSVAIQEFLEDIDSLPGHVIAVSQDPLQGRFSFFHVGVYKKFHRVSEKDNPCNKHGTVRPENFSQFRKPQTRDHVHRNYQDEVRGGT